MKPSEIKVGQKYIRNGWIYLGVGTAIRSDISSKIIKHINKHLVVLCAAPTLRENKEELGCRVHYKNAAPKFWNDFKEYNKDVTI